MNKIKIEYWVIAVYEQGEEDVLYQEDSYDDCVLEISRTEYESEYFYIKTVFIKQ